MSNICLQFGQCGNQLGAKFLDSLFQDMPSDSSYWFNHTAVSKVFANAVLVNNTYPSLTESSEHEWSYYQDFAIFGRSNHWAEGYNVLGPALHDSIDEKLRLLSETLDHVCGFMSIAGLCGGTGSGLLSYVTQLLRDNFPRKIVSNVAIIPKSQEQTTVHNYSGIFALSKMYDDADSIILCSNDDPCTNNPHRSPQDYHLTNYVFAERLSCLLQCDLNQNLLRRLPLLALHHDFKFLNVLSSPVFYAKTPNSKIPWKALLNNVESVIQSAEGGSQKKNMPESHGRLNKCISLLIALRDNTNTNFVHDITERYCNERMYPAWTSRSERFQIFKRNGSFSGRDRFWAVAVNNMHHLSFFENLIDKSWKSFNARAYVHQFCSEGVTDVDFVEAFLTFEQIIDSYKRINLS